MKARELMLGDWVKMYNGKGEYIDDTRIDIHTLYTFSQDGQNVLRLEPIPLTPEILEKNGWISDNHNDRLHVYNLRHGKGYSTIAISDDGKWSIEVSTEIAKKDKRGRADLVTFIRDWCDGFCVHELQHCLKLVGIEKDIVL